MSQKINVNVSTEMIGSPKIKGVTYFCCKCKKQEKKSKCFPSVAEVMLENGTSVRMSELQVRRQSTNTYGL